MTGRRERTEIHPDARALLRRCFRIARRLQSVGLIAGLAWRAAAIATPLVLQRAIDHGVVGDDRRTLAIWCIVLVGLGAVSWIGDAVRHLYVERGAYRALVDTRKRALTALIDADPDRAAATSPGEVIARVVDDCIRVRTWVSGSVTGLISALTLVVVVLLVAALDPVLALVALAIVPLSAILAVTQASANLDAALRSVSSAGQTAAWLEAAISGADTVKGLGAEDVVVGRAADRAATARADAVGLARIRGRWIASAIAIPGLGTAIGLWVGGVRAIDGEVTIGELVAFTGWMGLLAAATSTLTARLALRGTALAAAHRLSGVLRLPGHPAADGVGVLAAASGGVDLGLAGVDVRRGERSLLAGVSATVRAGEWVAVTGATGSGKSSLLRVLSGDVRAGGGVVEIDGIDLASLPWPTRAGLVTLVPQHPTTMTGSIGDVVRRGAPDASDDQVEALLIELRLGDLLDDLGGLDGRIGERGRTVSGGQRQRLAVAAALLRRSPLLLLDDVTSALDEDVEAAVLSTVRRHAVGSTVVLATHRVGPASAADRIIDVTTFVVAEPSSIAGGAE